MAQKFGKVLNLDTPLIKAAKELRTKSIDNAVALSRGSSRKDMDLHVLWSRGGYEVGVGKPGKETERKNPNVNDMWPFIRKGDGLQEKSATFDDINFELEHMGNRSPYALELLGCLVVRSALMLDHVIKNGRVTYEPPEEIVREITKDIPELFHVPLPVFLQYLEAIALNEDVKYQRRLNASGKPYSKDAGRPNNMLSCAHLIAVLLKRTSMVGYATGFSKKRGVSPLAKKDLTGAFPLLSAESVEIDDASDDGNK